MSLLLTMHIPLYLYKYLNIHQWLSYDVLTHHMMSFYPTVRMELSFVQFSLICSKYRILSKTEFKSIYYHFKCDHESISFEKPVRRECISRKT